MSDFDNILITYKERLILLSLRFLKKRNGNVRSKDLHKLYSYGLISENYLPARGPEGEYIPDGTYSLTDKAKRFSIYNRKQRFRRYLTPVIVAFLTSLVANLLLEPLLPELLNLLQGLVLYLEQLFS